MVIIGTPEEIKGLSRNTWRAATMILEVSGTTWPKMLKNRSSFHTGDMSHGEAMHRINDSLPVYTHNYGVQS